MNQEPALSIRVPIASLIGAFFGAAWAFVGCTGFTGNTRIVLMVTTGVLIAVFITRIVRRRSMPSHNQIFHRWPYLIAVGLEAAAIAFAAFLLPRIGGGAYLVEVIGIIAGLHFIGLWKASQAARYLFIAAGMCVFSIGAMIAQSALRSHTIGLYLTGFGNALVLLCGAGSRHQGQEAA